ncbi:MAG: tRNA (adenosine(37)-N6)-dimethylallyltransferase MiaA [Syntrophales bacterium]|jgi:tRNA dimethylallyltransferase|nr:tRNA (adenosine(37)-N6)-dimethylallyltransferase MiaA [Syntrophales bacterium]MDY0044006.1 tRNA (adenosine(37)-N6)-dimethylallyltransferase MiaA [Syntrophales bacterium]
MKCSLAHSFNIIVILGPTASGKTELAVRLAYDIGGEILSGDSRQVYRGMDLGTGKDLHAFKLKEKTIPYHLIDIVDPVYEYNLFEYQKEFYRAFEEIQNRRAIPILAGGSGLYIESVITGYDMVHVAPDPAFHRELEKYDMELLRRRYLDLHPALHNITDLRDRKRLIRAIEIEERSREERQVQKDAEPLIRPFVTGVRIRRNILHERIMNRLLDRLDQGMIEEVEKLRSGGLCWEKIDYFGLEYRYIGQYLQGILSYKEMIEVLATRIRQFAKRQETWFRRMERKGIVIHWFDFGDYRALANLIETHVIKYHGNTI